MANYKAQKFVETMWTKFKQATGLFELQPNVNPASYRAQKFLKKVRKAA